MLESFVTPTEIRLASGYLIDLLEPDISRIQLTDIATSLSRQERFTGHSRLRSSVAEHSVAVEYIAGLLIPDEMSGDPARNLNKLARAALMHDATEAYVSDLSSPAKRALRALSPSAASAFDELEAIVASYVYERFDCAPGEWAGIVHQADMLAYEYEAAWGGWGDTNPPLWLHKDPYMRRCYRTADGGMDAFLLRAHQLRVK